MGGGGVCGMGEGGAAFNQKMHIYLIIKKQIKLSEQNGVSDSLTP